MRCCCGVSAVRQPQTSHPWKNVAQKPGESLAVWVLRGTEEYERLAEHQTEGLLPIGSKGFYKACCMALVCVIGAALAAGLTMGLVSIDPMEMEIIVKTEDKDHTKPL